MHTCLDLLAQSDSSLQEALVGEMRRQSTGIELIPSENYTYPEVLCLLGSVFTNKYAEGYPGRRYYGGQEFTDVIENMARERACAVFGAEHANVQPLSGSPMNQAVYLGLLEPGDTILAMDLSHGGHLTHGAPVSHMGKLFQFIRYKTDPATGAIDMDEVMSLAKKHRPKLVLTGYTSYPRDMDYAAFKAVADSVGALTMTDASHYAGMVAGGAMMNPFDAGFDVVTTTSHKSLRGPRGGIILCRKDLAARIDKSVFPGLQGGPHMNVIAAIAYTMKRAAEPAFREYAAHVVSNAKALAARLMELGADLITGGTDNHMLVMNTQTTYGINGREAEEALDAAGITVNKQIVPDDPNPPLRPSGIRVGTPAATTRGMGNSDMTQLADWMHEILQHPNNTGRIAEIKRDVEHFCAQFPVPGIDMTDLDLNS
ncbi:serine hydroxymethyltransferase [Desulfovibrio inopinatus]|uniref:serine hydroxymethyltransferase n=1 Tax=Desulfovibrio inopinatus TaxID=102109 RepID=UPI00040A6636|nr:serine hydroxymethyltransferase [Desulfovibrio inopinatus]